MTQRQLEILQHAYGADQYGQGGGYRRYFSASAMSEDAPTCEELATLGFFQRHGQNGAYPDHNYTITEEGIAAMRAASPKPPKLSRSQQRYRRFLDWADAYGGTMREFFEYEKQKRSMDGAAVLEDFI